MKFELIANKELIIKIPMIYRNKNWCTDLILLQEILKTKIINGEILNKIKFDFTETEWADPLPLLSLLVSLHQTNKLTSNDIIFKLPDPSFVSLFQDSRLIKFIEEEGFLKLFQEFGIIENITKDAEYISKLINNKADLIYSDCTLLKAKIIDLSKYENEERFNDLINSFIEDIETNLVTKGINAFYLNNLIYKVKSFLNETIENVKNHAYPDEINKTVGIYVRYRNGLANKSLDYGTLKRLNVALKDEDYYCPKLHKEYLEIREGCVEIFVVDTGIGISESYKQRGNKWPLRNTTKEIFQHGKRGIHINAEGKSNRGGLFLIGKILEVDNDYLNLIESNEFVGGFLPYKHENNEYLEAISNGFIDGTYWIGRISWKTKPEDEIENWYFLQNNQAKSALKKFEYCEEEDYQNIIGEILEKSYNSSRLPSDRLYIIDRRFSKEFQSITPISEIENVILFLPPINLTKNALLKKVYDQLIDENTKFEKGNILVIADIPEDERVSYFEAFNDLKLNNRKYKQAFDIILLITRRLRICSFKRDKRLIKLNNKGTKSFFNPDNSFNVFKILSNLKSYDSSLLWKRINFLNSKIECFIEETIEWNDELSTLSGYLKFSEIQMDTTIEKLMLISMERILGFTPNKESEFINNDVLTKLLTNHANELFMPYRTGYSTNRVYIGSVFVTGQNKKNILTDKNTVSTNFNFYFFNHFQSTQKQLSLFSWGRFTTYTTSPNNYKRIGSSHVIAKGGYKSITIPRYDENGNSIYYRTPVETYTDWQNNKLSLLKIGNFNYEDSFDLFGIDFFKSLKHAFHYGNELAEFLVLHFFLCLGGEESKHLSKSEYWEKIHRVLQDSLGKEDYQNFLTTNFCKNTCLIVYPYHPNTSYAIKKIKSCIKEELTDRIIQLTPIKESNNGTSFLYSPDSFDRIKKYIEGSEENKREIVFFDDSIVSGRTRKQIKHILISLGATRIKTLGIIDRCRLPYKHQSIDTNRFYWRLDIPRLGDKMSNPLNRAIKIIEDFAINLNDVTKERVLDWKRRWGPTSVYVNSAMIGITPSYLKLNNPKKYFSLIIDEDSGDYIQNSKESVNAEMNMIELNNSYGLTINIAEIHALTGKDNRTIKYINGTKGVLSKGALIELICSQLLLFPKEFQKDRQFDLIKVLFQTLSLYKIHNNHTILAALTILSLENFYYKKLVSHLLNECQGISYYDCQNIDLRVLLSYLFHLNQINDPIFNFVTNCIISDKSTIKTYRRLHIELYQEREIHYSPLIAIFKKKDKPLVQRLDNALHSLLNIEECLLRLKDSNLLRINNINENNILKVVSSYIKDISRILSKNNISTTPIDEFDINDKNRIEDIIKESENDIVYPLIQVHSNLFFQISVSKGENPNFLNELYKIKTSITEKDWLTDAWNKKEKVISGFIDSSPIIGFSDESYKIMQDLSINSKNQWIFYDYYINLYIRDIIANAIYSSELFRADSDNHMEIGIYFVDKKIFQIIFMNKTSNVNADKAANNPNLLREHFEQLGGIYKNSLSENVLKVILEFKII